MESPPGLVAATAAGLRAAGCVFAEDEARLLIRAARAPAELDEMVGRRAAGQPIEHIVGWAEFCGLRIAVGPGVFVPRHRTEFLVRQAAALARQVPPPAGRAGEGGRPAPAVGPPPTGGVIIVDLCCGSGAVGAALAAAVGSAELHAADIDPRAVRYARRNLSAAGGRVYEGDLYEPLPARLRGRVTILTANVPYVPTGEVRLLPGEARVHEPMSALDGGPDGLAVFRRVAAPAADWLTPGGWFLAEVNERQLPAAMQALARGGLIPGAATSPDMDTTVVTGAKPRAHPGSG